MLNAKAVVPLDGPGAVTLPGNPVGPHHRGTAVDARTHPLPAAARLVADAPRWLLLAVLIFAPWAYGCTRPWSITILNASLLAIVGLWLAGCVVNRSRPRVNPVLLVSVILLLIQGWWMTLNAGFSYDAGFTPHPRPNLAPSFPAAVDYAAALPAMTGLSAMLGAVCLACAMAESRRWRKRLWITMALAGCSVIALGLAQKLTHAPGIFWRAEGHAPTFFGTFRYHANAGSFINIVWPLTLALLANSIRRRDALWVRVSWSLCFVAAIAGALANTSRASGLIALAQLGAWMLWLVVRLVQRRDRGEAADPAAVLGVTLFLVAVVAGVMAVGGFDKTLQRWEHISKEVSPTNSRLMVARVCVGMLPHSGWLGFGPGTFKTAFPFFNKDTSNATRGIWLQAHQDYLQTLVEWGWAGAALWAVTLGGGLVSAAWVATRRRLPSRDRYLQVGASAAIGAVLLHALGDFPLQIASIQLYVAILVGILWSASRWPCDEGRPPSTGEARFRGTR